MSLLATRRRDEAVQFMQANMNDWQSRIAHAAKRKVAKTGLHISDEDLEEAYGQAWFEMHSRVLEGEDITNKQGWLVNCTAMRLMDVLRKRNPGAFAEDVTTDDVEVPSNENVVELLDDRRKLAHLREAMREHLSDRQIQVAILIYLYGYTRQETADLLGIEYKRLEKIMYGDKKSRRGVTEIFSSIVSDIEAGKWCQQRGSLMRAYASNILDPDGERYQMAREHLAGCPACRRYVQNLRNLTAILPPVPLILAAAHNDHPFNQLAALADTAGGALDRTRETILHLAHQGHAHVDTVAAAGGGDGVGTVVKATGTGGTAAGAAAAVAAGTGGGAAVAGGAGTILAGGGSIIGLKIAATCVAAVAVGSGCVALTEQVTTHKDKPASAKVQKHTPAKAKPPTATTAAAATFAPAPTKITNPVAPPSQRLTSNSPAQSRVGTRTSAAPTRAPSAPQEFGFEQGNPKKDTAKQDERSSSNSTSSSSSTSTSQSQAAKEFAPAPAPITSSAGTGGGGSSSSSSGGGPSKAPSAQAEFGIEGG